MAEIYDSDAARVQPLDHPAFTYPAIARRSRRRRTQRCGARTARPSSVRFHRGSRAAQDRIEVGDATTINGRTTRARSAAS
jgi:hypothetical protein